MVPDESLQFVKSAPGIAQSVLPEIGCLYARERVQGFDYPRYLPCMKMTEIVDDLDGSIGTCDSQAEGPVPIQNEVLSNFIFLPATNRHVRDICPIAYALKRSSHALFCH
jgi:hypothetical protein